MEKGIGFMRFTKMHGIGNDYIYINCFQEKINDPGKCALYFSDRHTGIGSDGLVLIKPSDNADFYMEMYNADGSQAQMCGNAIRCVAKYVYEKGMTNKTNIDIDTLAGIKHLELFIDKDNKVENVRVDMGKPILTPENIPIISPTGSSIKVPITVGGKLYLVTCVSMGNPHAVVFMNDVQDLNIEKIGPLFENHEMFPERVNTEFCVVEAPDRIRMRVWERGAGETMACGTGSCATLVAAAECGLTDRKAEIILNGGSLFVEWLDDGRVFMTGPAEFVFEGEIDEPQD